MEFVIKPKFEEKYRKMLGEEYEIFAKNLVERPRKSIRANTIKISSRELVKKLEENGWKLERIPWFEDGFFVEVSPRSLTRTFEYYLGFYYIQEASSIIPPLVLDPKPGEIILDLCAAPGSKTTQMAAMMRNEGLIIANDNNLNRLKALRGNLQKCGVVNCVVTYMNGKFFWKKGLKFKKILLDVPCSGSGSIVTTWRIMEEWSEGLIRSLSNLQKMLLVSAYRCLEKEGIIVYSTCSMEPEENEEIIDFAVRKLGLEVERVKVKGLNYRNGFTEWDGKKYDESVANSIRIFPHDNKTEGFFICKLRK